jgi:subtilisin family serine protease
LLAVPDGVNPESLAVEISKRSDVFYCDLNYDLDAPEAVQSSQPFIDLLGGTTIQTQQSALTLDLPQAHAIATGTAVKVAVIDVGVNLTHPALATVAQSGFDFVSNSPVAQDVPGGISSGHGTFIAGVINLVAPQATIRSYRVLDSAGRGDGFMIARAVLRAVNDGCKVINLSCVMTGKHPSLDLAIEYAHDQNVMVIAAAGNDSSQVERFPANDSYVITVAALDSTGHKADFSNYGGKIDVCAPGTRINAEFLDTSYAYWSGTSFAAPFVAAEAALIYQTNPNITWSHLKNIITSTATSVDSLNPAFAGKLGHGRINLVAALQAAQEGCCVGMRGDVNSSGSINLADLSMLTAWLIQGSGTVALPCTNAANVNGNGQIDLADLAMLTAYLTSNTITLVPCN